mmetsp:Transcript_27240/g.33199  ORF Transcript_27240/g.33199 Transcript_27240/m.33199 type:complete len:400 (-) Transcript_27240:3314-4513(-)
MYGRNVGYISMRTFGRGQENVGSFFIVYHNQDCSTASFQSDNLDKNAKGKFAGEICVGTKTAWFLIRIAATPHTETAIHKQFQSKFRLMNIGRYLRVGKEKATTAEELPQLDVSATIPKEIAEKHGEDIETSLRGTVDALHALNILLRESNPSSPVCYDQLAAGKSECEVIRDDGLMALMDDFGFGPSVEWKGAANMDETILRGIKKGAKLGEKMSLHTRTSLARFRDFRMNGGWAIAPLHLGRYRTDYVLRGVAKRNGIGANNPEEAIYPTAYFDENGNLLDGAFTFKITFDASKMRKAASIFWSITAYDRSTQKLMDHPFSIENRHYSVSSQKGLKENDNGEIVILVRNQAPRDPTMYSNWLPVKETGFYLIARLYGPSEEVMKGPWEMPPIVKIEQ